MTRDDIIRMALNAGAWQHVYDTNPPRYGPLIFDDAALERFAALVAAAAVRETSAEYRLGWNDGAMMEREECAKVCEQLDADGFGINCCADEIRARGQE
jgi:hypothetical protein